MANEPAYPQMFTPSSMGEQYEISTGVANPTEVPEADQYTLAEPLPPPIPEKTLTRRSKEIDFALGEKSPGVATVYDTLRNGQEKVLRDSAARQEALELEAEKNQIIYNVVSKKKDITPDELEVLRSMSTTELKTDPDMVFERKLGNKVIEQAVGGTWFGPHLQQAARETEVAGSHLAWTLYQKRRLEELRTEQSYEQGWGSYISDIGGEMIPVLPWWRLSKAAKGVPDGSWTMGGTMEAVVGYAYSLPNDRRKKFFEDTIAQLKATNLRQAVNFAEMMVSFSTSDKALADVITLADFAGIGEGVVAGVKAVAGVAKASKAAKGAAAAVKAAGDVVETGVERDPNKLRASYGNIGPNDPVQTFQTGKGSTYDVFPDGTTIRNKAARPDAGHEGDSGIKPRTEKTIYVDANVASELSGAGLNGDYAGKGYRLAIKDGRATFLSWNEKAGNWGAAPSGRNIPFSTTPEIGKAPLELWKRADDVPGYEAYRGQHAGNPIVSLSERVEATVQQTARTSAVPFIRMPHRGPFPESQLELFDGLPPVSQQRSFPGAAFNRQQNAPTTESKLPPGKLRATPPPERQVPFTDGGGEPYAIGRAGAEAKVARDPVTGRMGRYPGVQQELDLPIAPTQKSFDFGGGTPAPSRVQQYFQSLRPGATNIELSPAEISASLTKEANAPEVIKRARETFADVIKATEDSVSIMPEHVLAAVGDTKMAATIAAFRRVSETMPSGAAQVAQDVMAIANPAKFWNSASNLYQGRAAEFLDLAAKDSTGLLKTFTDGARVPRMTPDEAAVAFKEAETTLRTRLGRDANDAILRVEYVPPEANFARVPHVRMDVGVPDKTLFTSKEQAELFRKDVYKLGDEQATVLPSGNRWLLRLEKAVAETGDAVSEAALLPSNMSPKSLTLAVTGPLRTMDTFFGGLNNAARKIATVGPNTIYAEVKDILQNRVNSLPAASKAAVDTMLRASADLPNPMVATGKGRWFETAEEFATAFMDRFKRLPTPEETLAYDSIVRIYDYELLLRNSAVYRDKARVGIENVRVKLGDTANGPVSTNWFDGKVLERMPWGLGKSDYDAGILVIDNANKQTRYFKKFDMTPAEKGELDTLVKNRGFKVIQTAAESNPFREVQTSTGPATREVHFVVAETSELKPLSAKQVLDHPGGHQIYAHEWYGAQPRINPNTRGGLTYNGDNVMISFSSRAEAEKWTPRMDKARKLLGAEKMDEYAKYVRANLPWTPEDFASYFTKGFLDLKTPIVFKRAETNTFDSVPSLRQQFKDLVDGTKNPHDLYAGMDTAFLRPRDPLLPAISELGGEGLRLVSADILDPFPALQKGLDQAVRNIYMNDYKQLALQQWIKEAGPLMDVSPETLRAFPTHFLYNPQWNNQTADKVALASAKMQQKALVNFLGTRSDWLRTTDWVQQQLLDSVYKARGESGIKTLEKIGQTTTALGLGSIKDPVTFTRGIAFNAYMGFYNIAQFALNAQTAFHSIAVAGPKHGLSGAIATPILRAFLHRPDFIDTGARIAKNTSMGAWTEETFKEMFHTLKNSGWGEIMGEVAVRDNILDHGLFRSKAGRILDGGTFFFAEGERIPRLTGFASAFHEWRAANPTAKITDAVTAQIIQRADVLTNNMTRASSAAIQQGVFAIPTQFWGYYMRLADQFWSGGLSNSGILTRAEKARAIGMYSLLYGVPATGGAVTMYPVYESFKSAAADRGYDLSPAYMQVFTEGLLSMMVEEATGKKTNFAQRFGPGSNTTVKDILSGDTSFLEILGGVSGGLIFDGMSTLAPFYHKAASVFTGNDYPISSSDWMAFARNVKSVDSINKAMVASAYQKWYTKGGVEVADADTMDGFLAILGLSPRAVSDTFIKRNTVYERQQHQREVQKQALTEFRSMLSAYGDKDFDRGREHERRANFLMSQVGDFTAQQKSETYSRAISEHGSLEKRVNWDLVRTAPQSKHKANFDAYFNSLKKD